MLLKPPKQRGFHYKKLNSFRPVGHGVFSSFVDALRSSVQRPMRVCGAVDDDSNCAELQSAKALIMAGVGHHSRSELVRTFLEGVTYWSIAPGKLFKTLEKVLSAFLRLVDVHSCSVRMKSAMRLNLNGVNDHCMFLVLTKLRDCEIYLSFGPGNLFKRSEEVSRAFLRGVVSGAVYC